MFYSAIISLVFIFAAEATLVPNLRTYRDVTTIGKIVQSSPRDFGYNASVIVVVRGKARGLPLRNKENIFIDATYAGRPCCLSWTHEGWTKLNSTIALNTDPPLDPQSIAIDLHNATLVYEKGTWCEGSSICIPPTSVWVLQRATGYLRSPTLPTSAAHGRICVTIVARINSEARITVAMQHSGGPGRFQMGVLQLKSKKTNGWLLRRLVKDVPKALKNKTLDIVVSATQPEGNQVPVMVQWVTSCNPEGDEDVYDVSEKVNVSPLSSGFNVMVRSSFHHLNVAYMNAVPLDVVTYKYRRASEFSGGGEVPVCGPDAFGADCLRKCSSTFVGPHCRGLLLCGAGEHCHCAPGFRGPQCTEECERGRFGKGCRESCARCTDDQACDLYTGRCK